MRSLACATYESVMQSKASHVVISLNNVLSLGEQTEYMRDRAGIMSHHRTTAPNVAFAPKKPPLVATMPQSKRKMEKQMASDQYIRQIGRASCRQRSMILVE